MAFSFREFLDLAEELAQRPDDPAWRSVVSRAYYAVVHAAYAALPLSERTRISHGAVHRRTWKLYTDSSQRLVREIGHIGHDLRLARIAADYDPPSVFTGNGVALLLSRARRLLSLLDRHGYQP